MVDGDASTITNLIGKLAWPIVTLVALAIFHRPISTALMALKELKIGNNKAVFGISSDAASMKAAATRKKSSNSQKADLLYCDIDAFASVSAWLDMGKFDSAVGAWAKKNHAVNQHEMGINNFRMCLFELGLPGGAKSDLEWIGDGEDKQLKVR